jgi:hypothetical protein
MRGGLGRFGSGVLGVFRCHHHRRVSRQTAVVGEGGGVGFGVGDVEVGVRLGFVTGLVGVGFVGVVPGGSYRAAAIGFTR